MVIVGASFAGISLTRKLLTLDAKDHQLEIVLIDINNFFEFICTTSVNLHDEHHFPRTSINFNKLRESFRSAKVSFKRGKLVKVHDKS